MKAARRRGSSADCPIPRDTRKFLTEDWDSRPSAESLRLIVTLVNLVVIMGKYILYLSMSFDDCRGHQFLFVERTSDSCKISSFDFSFLRGIAPVE